MDHAQSQPANIFEERAEHLPREALLEWTVTTTQDRATITKLKGPGAKLLIGPRGSGKSTLLRTAYFNVLDSGQNMAVYVNYGRSLALEPLFRRTSDALQMFRQWVLLKIAVGFEDALREIKSTTPSSLAEILVYAHDAIYDLEAGLPHVRVEKYLAPSQVTALLESWTLELGRKRCILLLDDAAHAFSPEQQREFFEIFRSLRSHNLSAKAAVYPGATSYSPHFHVGHEAQLVEAWYRPENEDYLELMREIVVNRLPPRYQAKLHGKEDLVDLLALASFGLPRGFLTMLSQLLGADEDDLHNPTRRRAESAIADHVSNVNAVYSSLSSKIPRYRKFVEVGSELTLASIKSIQHYNSTKPGNSKAVTIAFPLPLDTQLTRTIELLEYAGLIREGHTVSRGVKGRFQRYTLHYALLIEGNAMSLGRSYTVAGLVDSFVQRNAHSFVRAQPKALLGADYMSRCIVDLAPCPNCGASRASENARFCITCGKPLETESVYDELLKSPIDMLPLTDNKIRALLLHSNIRTVNDIISDEDHTKVRAVPGVGPVWAAKIRQCAEEFISV